MIRSICWRLVWVSILLSFAGCAGPDSQREGSIEEVEVAEEEQDELSQAHDLFDTNLDARKVRITELTIRLRGLASRSEELEGKRDRSTIEEVSEIVGEEIDILDQVVSIHRANKEGFLVLASLNSKEAHNADMRAMDEEISEMVQGSHLSYARSLRRISTMYEEVARIFESFEDKANQHLAAMRKQREYFLKLLD